MGEMRRDLDEELRDALRALPLLPLPGTVFFANTLLPIHVCNERHIALLDEVLGDSRWLGVVLWPTGNKNPERVGQLAKVVQHIKVVNGCYDLVL
jgi:Lon protease-like protein